jgi:predicted CXXCH cytochrome family protein
VLAACAAPTPVAAPAATTAPASASARRMVPSNVTRADYVGSRECGDCHADIAAEFERSPMHNMTRRADAARIRAPAEAVFEFAGERATFTQVDGRRHLRFAGHDFTITKVIGGRTREDFVGTEGGDELVLPVSYLFTTGAFRYKGYSVMLKERPRLVAGPVWRRTCIFCHNTVPYLSTIYDDLGGDATHGYQGSASDRLLPADRIRRLIAADPAALAGALGDEIAFLGAPRPDAATPLKPLLDRAIVETRRRFDEGHLVELGIGCEACHLGARAHVADPELRPSLQPRGAVAVDGPTATRAETINRVCLRCHTVLFSQYNWTWEGGHRDPSAGGSTINSGEARDFLLGGCARALACTACHDPHGEDGRAKLDALGGPEGNRVCAPCHAGMDGPAHTHHAAGSAGSACLACHMPKKNMGLALELTRYHRIGSPTDATRVLRDRPLECALCHGDRSVAWIVEAMERLWGRRYPRAPLVALYGALDVNVLDATLARGLPHEQAVAAGVTTRAETIAPLLGSDYPLVRQFAERAIARLTTPARPTPRSRPRRRSRCARRRWPGARRPRSAPGR